MSYVKEEARPVLAHITNERKRKKGGDSGSLFDHGAAKDRGNKERKGLENERISHEALSFSEKEGVLWNQENFRLCFFADYLIKWLRPGRREGDNATKKLRRVLS